MIMVRKPADTSLRDSLRSQAEKRKALKQLREASFKGLSSEETKKMEELTKKVEEVLHRPMSSYQDWIGAMNEICDLAFKIWEVISHRVGPFKVSPLDRLGLILTGKIVSAPFKILGKLFGSEEPINFSAAIDANGKLQFAASYKGAPLNESEKIFLHKGMAEFAASSGKGYAFNSASETFVNKDGSALSDADFDELNREFTKLSDVLSQHFGVKFKEEVHPPIAPSFGQ